MLDTLWTYLNGTLSPLLDTPPTTAPSGFRLAAVPNPARGEMSLDWSLPVDGRATLEVLDLAGRRLRVLWTGATEAGVHRSRWNGRNDRGEPLAPGIYVARLASPTGTRTLRIARVR